MGRLFWKIFFAFWLTALAAAAVTGTAVWLQHHPLGAAEPELAQGPGAMLAGELASATLRHGGVEALREWLKHTRSTQRPSLLAVDAQGRALLDRPVPTNALARARGHSWERGDRADPDPARRRRGAKAAACGASPSD